MKKKLSFFVTATFFRKLLQQALLIVCLIFGNNAISQDLTYGTADIVAYTNGAAASVLKTGNGVTISQIGTQGTVGAYIELNNSNATPVLNSTTNDAITISTTRNIQKIILTYAANNVANTTNPYVGFNATETAMGSASVAISSCLMGSGVTGTTQTAVEYIAPVNSNFAIFVRNKACSPSAANSNTPRISKIEVYLVPGPTITTTGSLFSFVQSVGTPSATQTYSVSGANLSNDIVITPPTNFEVSNNGGSNWYTNSTPLTLTQSGGTVSSTTITVRLNSNTPAVYSGNIVHTSTSATTKNVAVSGNTSITYYSKSSGDLTSLGTWGTNTDGTGTAPSNFTNDYQAFNIRNNAAPSIASAWTVSGLGSRVILGDGSTPINFVVTAANSINAVLDVANNATVTMQNTTNPTFGTLTTGSNVVFDGSTSLTIPVANYYNLSSTNDGGASRTLAPGTVAVAGSFAQGNATYTLTGNTVSFNGQSAQSLPTFSFNNLSLDNASATITGNTTASGLISINENAAVNGTLTIAAGGTLTVANSKTLTINGILDNQSLGTITLNGGMTVSSGGIYKANADVPNSYSLPAANYSAGSEILILQGSPRLNQTTIGGNVTWSSAGSGNLLNSTPITINGNFTITTGGPIYNGSSSTGRTLTVGGNFNVQGGEYDVSGAGPGVRGICTLNVNGTVSVSGGILYVSADLGGPGFLNANGDINHTAGTFGVGYTGVPGGGYIGTILLNAPTAQTVTTPANLSSMNLTIGSTATPSVTLNANVTVSPSYTLLISGGSLLINPNKTLNIAGTANFNNKSVTLKSDATGTATISQITGTLSFASNVTVQRFIVGGASNGNPGRRAFRFLSHPFSGYVDLRQLTNQIDVTGTGATLVPSAANFTQSGSNAASAFWFNPLVSNNASSDAGWQAFTNTLPIDANDANAWKSGQGIRVLVRGAKGEGLLGGSYTASNVTLNMTGQLNVGTTPIAVSLATNSAPGTGWNLVGNPLPASIEIKAKLKAIRDADGVHQNYLGATAYVWNPNKALTTKGGYDAIDLTTVGNYYLPMNGVIMLQTAINNNTALTFSESDKNADAGVSVFRTNGSNNSLVLGISDANDNLLDETLIRFNKNAALKFEPNDGGKLLNEYALYTTTSDNVKAYINSQPEPATETIIPLGIYSSISKDFVLKATEINLPIGVDVYLKDKFLNKQIAITGNNFVYPFSVTSNAASTGESRFELLFSKSIVPVTTLATSFSIKLSPNPAIDILKVTFSNEEKANTSIVITDVVGKTVKTIEAGNVQAGEMMVNLKGLAKGSYYVTLNNGKEKKTEKLQIQ